MLESTGNKKLLKSCLYFRNHFKLGDLAKELFEEINRQIENKGFVVKAGTLIDATFYPAATRPPGKDKKPRDPEASWGAKEKARIKRFLKDGEMKEKLGENQSMKLKD